MSLHAHCHEPKCRSLWLLVLDQLRQRSAKRCTCASTHRAILVARCRSGRSKPTARALQRPSTAATVRAARTPPHPAALKSP